MSRFKLSSITKAMTEAINAAPDVDALSKTLGAPPLAPRIVAEYGSLHSATCLDYDPVQRLLAVGVDTGVKVLGADGLAVLLATPKHLEPALRVRFVSSVGRVLRVSVEGGVDVWDLRSQTLLASTRWPNEVTSVAGLRRSPFILIGEASGAVRVAAVRPGAKGGVLAPRAYAVTRDQAMGAIPWELKSPEELRETRSRLGNAACVAVEPQPGFETARALFAYADGGVCVWDFHGKKPAAVAHAREASGGEASRSQKIRGELRCATWVGHGGGGHSHGTRSRRRVFMDRTRAWKTGRLKPKKCAARARDIQDLSSSTGRARGGRKHARSRARGACRGRGGVRDGWPRWERFGDWDSR
jgi:hypothetical protein